MNYPSTGYGSNEIEKWEAARAVAKMLDVKPNDIEDIDVLKTCVEFAYGGKYQKVSLRSLKKWL